jgi:putative membrane protein
MSPAKGPAMNDETKRPPRPALVEWDDADHADPGLAAHVPDEVPSGRAMQTAARLVTRQASGWSRFVRWVFGSLFALVVSTAIYDYVTGLFSENTLLGWVAFVLTGLALLILAVMALREVASYSRLRRLDALRAEAEAARARADLPAARKVADTLASLYATRPEVAWGRAKLAEQQADMFDADALLSLCEQELLAPLDRAALAEVEAAARQVGLVTAMVPLALADVATALYANLRMARRLSEIYGGRAGTFGTWRLMTRVFGAVLGAGALALTDDLLGSVAGGGVLSKLSRRFGEGVVNAGLTARVGIAAMEVCRPMPFVAAEKPKVTGIVSRALSGLMSRGTADRD